MSYNEQHRINFSRIKINVNKSLFNSFLSVDKRFFEHPFEASNAFHLAARDSRPVKMKAKSLSLTS